MTQALTDRMRGIWETGGYQPIAATEVLVGELLARAIDVHHGERVLDVAAGTGNAALAAARRGGVVTATDFAPAMLATAGERAAVEGLELRTEVADAQDLPFPDGSFDVVLSTFGVMHAPDHQRAADELIRVCRPGGRIGLASWTPDGMVGRGQSTLPARLQPPVPVPAPTAWGTEEHCRALFGGRISTLSATPHLHEFCAASAASLFDFLNRHLPPIRFLRDQLEPAEWEAMAAQRIEQFESVNRATDGTLVAEAAYLEVIATVA
jgi:ubiquinone/menaquinone biosynthesis C-methylase UbiE